MIVVYNCCIVEKLVRTEQNRIEKTKASELDARLEVEEVKVYCTLLVVKCCDAGLQERTLSCFHLLLFPIA